MPSTSFVRDDRALLVVMGVATAAVVTVMGGILLTAFRDETKIKAPPPKTQYITQDTEDSLKLGTLESLLGHYNYSIRDTASRIICDRAENDGTTIEYLVYGITRPDYEERIKCLKALALITNYSQFPRPELLSGVLISLLPDNLRNLHTPNFCTALVRSLELCLDDVEHERLDDKYYDEYFLRDIGERLCLMFVSQLMTEFDTQMLVEAKFVEKWLVKQNWGDADNERQRNFHAYIEFKTNRLKEISKQLQESEDGRKALEKAGLISQERAAELANNTGGNRVSLILEIQMPMGDNDNEGDHGPLDRTGDEAWLRTRRGSADIRRQHREAMVLNDGTRPLGQDDIIQSRNHNQYSPV